MEKATQSGKTSQQTSDPRTITLCGAQGCCPTATFTDSGVTITDDDGGKVTLTDAQLDSLIEQRQKK